MSRCKWFEDADDSSFDTDCGNRYIIIDGTPIENNFQFCPYCGGELVEADDETEDDN